MPLRYWYHCEQCEYRALRYRNVRRCPECGGNLIREQAVQDGATPQERSQQSLQAAGR